MASDEQFSLCWNNFHANMSAGFHGLLSRGDLVDVTLAAEGRLLQAHKLVLSVCSPYFQEMFKMNPTQHPIVFLKDVSHSALRDLLQFMYQGEVNVKQEELASFISTAEQLQVKGLTGNQNEDSSTPSKPKPTSRPGPRSSQQRQSVMKLETDLDSKPSSTPVAIKRPNRPSIASNNSSSSQSGPAKRKCVDPLEAGPSGSAKEEFVTIPDEDENNAVAPKMEPEFVNESMWDDDEDGANNDETNFGEDDSNMEMTGFDGSATGDGNMSGGGEGGAVGDAQVEFVISNRGRRHMRLGGFSFYAEKVFPEKNKRSTCVFAWVRAGVLGCGCAGAVSTRRIPCVRAWCAGGALWEVAVAKLTRKKAPFTNSSVSIITWVDVADGPPPSKPSRSTRPRPRLRCYCRGYLALTLTTLIRTHGSFATSTSSTNYGLLIVL
ncbi:protein tramtrack, beta isoform isoform X7 [Amyelois transitella]|uniref:protein tramtrack, beta isoform isoform X7 n=1 Tax=Amyelois transitella TaxID=680683 RepID=UPI0029900B5B|nr:protein tramtrack, beta isoform isoform X7 [Amyelois transitella]